ncbi:DNA-binding protein [Natrarchaeobius halalkaliphilus]|uniref:DNA-binding protein n=1 Tax=Natrarchaeobius halalkaliphilus TaxID=1679091 RepID=A0A3N6P1E3_9EURY|nr:helix-turn-helix domain-containing protein [Natrarchaeobius halalkaliphilus]RQG91309.1 DNA-binding protein [Natrarchaeobius halalkaliphilus]
MRYATVVLTWTADELDSIDGAFARSDAVSIRAIRDLTLVDDRRYVELLELRGDLECGRSLLAGAPDALEYAVAGRNGRGHAYVTCRSVAPVTDLLAILREHEIVLDWPIAHIEPEEWAGTGCGLEVTVIGTNEAIQRAATALPEGIDLTVQRTGEYDHPGRGGPTLTPRQRDVFEVALRDGYYEIPRETTHRELADRLEISPGTVGEHLQRIERNLALSEAEFSG